MLGYLTYELANNPDVQQRLIDEIDAVIDDVGYIELLLFYPKNIQHQYLNISTRLTVSVMYSTINRTILIAKCMTLSGGLTCPSLTRPGHTKDHHKNGTNCLPAWHVMR